MNLRKFVAPTSTAALRLARAALGPDAVVLSTRQVNGQTELLALAGDEADRIASQPSPWPQRESQPIAPARAAAAAPAAPALPLADWAHAKHNDKHARVPQAPRNQPQPAAQPQAPAAAKPQPQVQPSAQAPIAAPAPIVQQAAPRVDAQVLAEIRRLQGMVESQSAALTWMEAGHRRPLRAQLMRGLAQAGFGTAFAQELTENLPDDFGAARARDWLRDTLAARIRCADPFALLEESRILALVGATGVGKTTSTAKLAARAAMRLGAQQVGLISTDTFRVGAQDQLRIFARILGVPLQVCHDVDSLKAALAAFSSKRVVLIDTVGLSQRDPRVAEQNAMLEAAGARRVLLLNAAAQAGAIEEAVDRHATGACAGVALTKLDEAVTLGGALEPIASRGLTLRFVSNGQRVPEDLHGANARLLAHSALRAMDRAAKPASRREAAVGEAVHA